MDTQTWRDITPWCRIRIDGEGRWFYENQEIINPGVLHAFFDALEMCADGRYRIVLDQEICYVEVEDTPFVAIGLRGDNETGFNLVLNSGKICELEPATLSIGRDNIMYARLSNGMPVRLLRPAYYHLALRMEECETGEIVLRVGQATYPILTQTHP
ncbi:MAG: hypothetical protein ABFD81_06260 [Syntrophaceae bacterium]